MEPLKRFASGRPVWGTCAGMIFMARDIGQDQPLLGLMNIVVERNAFGRQVDSFEVGLDIAPLAVEPEETEPFPAVFIRAPKLVEARGEAQVLARLPDGSAVAAREGHWLVTSFHPELTDDLRFHRFFLRMVAQNLPEPV